MSIKRRSKLLALFLAALMCASALTSCALGNSSKAKYNKALELTEQGDYEAAYALFTELGDYKDAEKEAAKFHYALTDYTFTYTEEDYTDNAITTISYNENNLPVQVIMAYDDGFQHTCHYTYNEKGQQVTVSCSNTKGVTGSYNSTYSEDGKLAKIEASFTDGYIALYEYFYDENGNLVKIVSEDDGVFNIIEYSYDGDNRISQILEKDKDGNTVLTKEHLYDEKGNLIKINYIRADSKTDVSEYTYNENGYLIKEHYVEAEGYVGDYEYTCDANGNRIKEHMKDNEDYEETLEFTYKLVYVPFAYSEESWGDLHEHILYW